jgi:hypothetical protein
MASIVANIEAALIRVEPSLKVPFYLLWLYVLDPPSEYLVRVETLAGVGTTLETLTPTSTIRHVQCAYRAAQLVTYLISTQLVVPPSFGQTVADKLYEAGYVIPVNFWTKTLKLTDPELLQAIYSGPTDFTDTFAVQLCALSTLDKRVQLGTATLDQLGLGSNVPLTLTVTIRADRALYDAAPKPSAELEARLLDRNRLLTGREPSSPTPFDDQPLIYEGVRKDGTTLYYASAALQNDRDIVMAAIQQSSWALCYASADLQNDRDIVLAAVQRTGLALQYTSAALRNDRDIVLAAVQQLGWALEYASATLRNDREIVKAAVQQTGYALRFASDELQADPEIKQLSR